MGALHLVKLCVGVETVAELESRIARRARAPGASGNPSEYMHVTRMFPRRAEELLQGGSLYWVMRGAIACRQGIVNIRAGTSSEGQRRCAILLDPAVIPVAPRPRAPFQGWRYLAGPDAPPDLAGSGIDDMPHEMRRELAGLGLL